MALDSSGTPHIAYRFYSGRSIRYASRGPAGGWTFTEFETDPDMEDFISMALDAAGRPHVAYWDGTFSGEPNDLKYARWDGAAWVTEIVDSPGNVGRGAALALDSAGHPHISYYDETHQSLKYAAFDGVRWNVATLESVEQIAFNFRTAIAVDSHDRVHIVYSAYHQTPQGWKGRLGYALFDGTAWNFSTIVLAAPTRDLRIPAIAVDSNDRPQVTYLLYYNVETYPNQLTYARWDGMAWHFEIIDVGMADSQDANSIALDSAGRPHVAYASESYTLIHAVGDVVTGVGAIGNETIAGGGANTGSGPTGDPDDIGGAQGGIHLHAVEPNPGRAVDVRFDLAAPARADLAIVNAAGRRVATLVHGWLPAGEHACAVPAELHAGVYVCVLEADGARATRKIVVK